MKSKIIQLFPIIGILILFVLIININSQENNDNKNCNSGYWVKYSPELITLAGKLTIKASYGAPGYGENPQKDKIEKYFVLVLENPINIVGDTTSDLNNDTVYNITQIQLDKFDLAISYNLEKFVGKKLVVQGKLNHSATIHDHTVVILNLTKYGLDNTKGLKILKD